MDCNSALNISWAYVLRKSNELYVCAHVCADKNGLRLGAQHTPGERASRCYMDGIVTMHTWNCSSCNRLFFFYPSAFSRVISMSGLLERLLDHADGCRDSCRDADGEAAAGAGAAAATTAAAEAAAAEVAAVAVTSAEVSIAPVGSGLRRFRAAARRVVALNKTKRAFASIPSEVSDTRCLVSSCPRLFFFFFFLNRNPLVALPRRVPVGVASKVAARHVAAVEAASAERSAVLAFLESACPWLADVRGGQVPTLLVSEQRLVSKALALLSVSV
jgi:hypothetical protein